MVLRQVQVYKANMIIPQIADNLTRSGTIEVTDKCPICHESTQIQENVDVRFCIVLIANVQRKTKSFRSFTSRDAMNIEGLSEATLEKFVVRTYK